ncbi:CKLF-like MARVEL transmembrane domain-containing protein 4 [Coccinella septempunctata]|uniref:CKLF-like MARVEL transmembrane domain-containing protein 4 n=1 Tax=Coccinella septempunctata TaxID=41139 RepID=UPI001D081E63|nr:CKLF-like MARVEL transmembrane domain-containing protein 4 [Coccinella septempunctata]XP_044751604.1 CKLF-like MARVEL transmembrane domain-containing protein 4 [Coccinella septempunctata]XP_044751605.1 CKLF-like MARVEL transmembrane domain-containing protein 4 [Coccinella septempunctata]
MSQPGFPGHITTSTVYSSTRVNTSIRWDPSYIQTLPGVLKIVQIVCSFIGFICIEASGLASHTRGGFFNFVALVAVLFTGILLIFYLLHIIEKTFRIPWLMVEFAFCAIWAFGFFAVSIMAATYGSDAYLVAAFFGFCCMVAYAFDAFLKYSALKRGEIAQGERTAQKQTNVTDVY